MSTATRTNSFPADSSGPPGQGIGDAEARPGEPTGKKRSRSRSVLVDVLILLAAALIGAFGTKAFVAQVFAIPSYSMQNTLTAGERIIVEKITYLSRDPQAGDVVVFDGKGLFREPVPGANMFVKRVIGVGGDRIKCCDASGKLLRNGQPVDESAYLKTGQVPSAMRFDVIVPADHLWVMGDNRGESADSRAYLGAPGGGFIPVDRVVGKAMVVAWPLSSARWIESVDNRS